MEIKCLDHLFPKEGEKKFLNNKFLKFLAKISPYLNLCLISYFILCAIAAKDKRSDGFLVALFLIYILSLFTGVFFLLGKKMERKGRSSVLFGLYLFYAFCFFTTLIGLSIYSGLREAAQKNKTLTPHSQKIEKS